MRCSRWGVQQSPVRHWRGAPWLPPIEGSGLEIAKLLLENGADPDRPRPGRRRLPLYSAASAGHAQMVALLIEHGCKVSLPDLYDVVLRAEMKKFDQACQKTCMAKKGQKP